MSDGRIAFQIDELVVDLELSEAQTARLRPVLVAAFEELGRRLQAAPATRWRKANRVVVSELGIDALSSDELLGPRGAERLADAFYFQLKHRGALS